jgi:hypothetical protein
MTDDILKGLFIGLILAWVGYRFGMAHKRKEKNEDTRQKFIETISKEIAVLENGKRTNFERFENIFESQKCSAIAFENTLGFFRRKKFIKLWRQYEYTTKNKQSVQPANCIGYTNYIETLSILRKLLKIVN